MREHGNNAEGTTYSVDDFLAAPQQLTDECIAEGDVIILTASGQVAMIISACSFDQLDDDE